MAIEKLSLDGLISTASEHMQIGQVGIRPNVVKDIAEKHANAEVQRFTQYLKDQGFCADHAFSNHVMDCFDGFNAKEQS